MFLRLWIQRLFNKVTIKRTISLNSCKKSIYLSLASQLKYLRWEFDRDLLDLASREIKKDFVVYDLGANCGVFTAACTMAADGVEVIAVEPDLKMFRCLHRNFGHMDNVVLLNAAVNSEDSLVNLKIAKRGRATNTISAKNFSSQMGGVERVVAVQGVKFSTLVERHRPPDFVKVDVEGAEDLFFQGGVEVIRKFMPTIYIEIAYNNHYLIQELVKMGYMVCRESGKNFLFTKKK